MLTKEQATSIAEEYLKGESEQSRYTFVVIHVAVREFEYGWMFPYQTTRYLETRNPLHGLGGNGPIIVNKYDGSISIMGTAHRPEYYLDEYINKMKNKDQ